jgi:hypothetical protein
MAVKFAAYESMRQLHKNLNNGKSASPQVRAGPAVAQAGVLGGGAACPGDPGTTHLESLC